MNLQNKLDQAENLGEIAYNEDKMRVFAQDSKASDILAGNEVGDQENSKVMTAWYRGYDLAKEAFMRKTFPEFYQTF